MGVREDGWVVGVFDAVAPVGGEEGWGCVEVVGGVEGVCRGGGAVADAVEDGGGHEGAVEEGGVGVFLVVVWGGHFVLIARGLFGFDDSWW